MIEALALTARLAVITTVVLLLLGIPFAYWLSRTRWRWKPLIEATVALPLVLPPTVLGFYLLLLLGERGWLGQLWGAIFHAPLAFTFPSLVIASVFYSLPFAVQPLHTAFQQLEPELLESAWTSGATHLQAFWHIVLPNCMQGVLSATVLAFAHTMGEFGVILMVGGNIPGKTRTVSIALYDLVEALDYTRAGQLALALLAISYGILALFYVINRKIFSL